MINIMARYTEAEKLRCLRFDDGLTYAQRLKLTADLMRENQKKPLHADSETGK